MSRLRSPRLAPFTFGVALSVVPLFGHHGTGASYDQKKWVKFEGKVTEFLWRNPHSSLFIEGKDEAGKTVNYSVEMFSPGQMVKQGYTRTVFKTGDHVVIEVHPSFTNPLVGECLGCKILVNGKEPGNPGAARDAGQ
jgi:hypothetical protein